MIDKEKYPRLSRPDVGREMKQYSRSELKALCAEIRAFLIESLSASGGHLASNLGVIELTVALEYCFDPLRDRLVFDVGHQCYPHKLLTGRAAGFSRLRKKGGLSGFPRPSESPADAFVAGHGSTSLSVAAGLARANRLSGGDPGRRFIALIGDGAMSGGMVSEALNDAGAAKLPLIVVLNDNGMSISRTVGALSAMLTRMRVNPEYRNAKKVYHSLMDTLPNSGALDSLLKRVKNNIKYTLIPASFFEGLGFQYIGPVDGHDLDGLIWLFQALKTYDRPVVVHTVTQKGRGWSVTERSPERFHAVEGYRPDTGEFLPSRGESLSSVFGAHLTEMAGRHREIVAVTAAMGRGSGLVPFARRYANRYFDVGIAEEHAVTMAAGMAAGGLRPFCAIYSTFLQRSFDQILHDVGIMGLPVVFCVDRAGFVAGDGETHQGLYDVGMLSLVPGMRIYCPANAAELKTTLDRVYADPSGPAAIRYPRGAGARFDRDTAAEDAVVLARGEDVTLVTFGRLTDNALAAAELLAGRGIRAGVIKLNRIFPAPADLVDRGSAGPILVCEELAPSGSTAQRLAAALPHRQVYGLNAGDRFLPQDTAEGLIAACGLDAEGMARRAGELCRGN
ncbi:MAG: 1-deoxy-D-xylulose-5-phosphate synthase [Oscillospiraceae bacterium]|nr:1-deoxy-D-xylulose-5-phosphate synthase [Oscillospiraceae bacterium]